MAAAVSCARIVPTFQGKDERATSGAGPPHPASDRPISVNGQRSPAAGLVRPGRRSPQPDPVAPHLSAGSRLSHPCSSRVGRPGAKHPRPGKAALFRRPFADSGEAVTTLHNLVGGHPSFPGGRSPTTCCQRPVRRRFMPASGPIDMHEHDPDSGWRSSEMRSFPRLTVFDH